MTYDSKIGQLTLSGLAHNGVQVNVGFLGKETSSTKISNDEWSLSIPGKLISGKQKILAVLLGKNGELLSKNSINFYILEFECVYKHPQVAERLTLFFSRFLCIKFEART